MAGVLTSDPADVMITVLPVNHAPDLTAIEDMTVNEGAIVSFSAAAIDPDAGDALTYSLDAGPTGATIDPDTGLFSWSADDGYAQFSVTVRVTVTSAPSTA